MLNITKWPLWLKSGLSAAVFFTGLVMLLPEQFSNLAFVPWYLTWLIFPAFLLFGTLCLVFRVDFVSNYHPSEGPWRHVILPTLWIFSLFVTAFIIGAIVGVLIKYFSKRKR